MHCALYIFHISYLYISLSLYTSQAYCVHLALFLPISISSVPTIFLHSVLSYIYCQAYLFVSFLSAVQLHTLYSYHHCTFPYIIYRTVSYIILCTVIDIHNHTIITLISPRLLPAFITYISHVVLLTIDYIVLPRYWRSLPKVYSHLIHCTFTIIFYSDIFTTTYIHRTFFTYLFCLYSALYPATSLYIAILIRGSAISIRDLSSSLTFSVLLSLLPRSLPCHILSHTSNHIFNIFYIAPTGIAIPVHITIT
jgi:hypothetical protein